VFYEKAGCITAADRKYGESPIPYCCNQCYSSLLELLINDGIAIEGLYVDYPRFLVIFCVCIREDSSFMWWDELLTGGIGLLTRKIHLSVGEIGLLDGGIGLLAREISLFVGEIHLSVGKIGLFYGEIGLLVGEVSF